MLILGLIVIFLFREGMPIFQQISVFKFIFGSAWYPTYDPPEYGIWPLIVGSLGAPSGMLLGETFNATWAVTNAGTASGRHR